MSDHAVAIPQDADGEAKPVELTPGQQLRRAALQGDVQDVRRLCEQFQGSIDACDQGEDNLIPAVGGGDEEEEGEAGAAAPAPAGGPAHGRGVTHKGTGETALHVACEHNQAETVKVLGLLGANVEVANRWGSTPLLKAASSGSLECVTVLVDIAANLGARNFVGNTALHLAAYGGHAEVCRFLAKKMKRSDVLAKNKVGLTAWGYCQHAGAREVLHPFFQASDQAAAIAAAAASADADGKNDE